MFAFLKLIPIRDWLYATTIVVLLTWGGCALHRHDGRVAVKAQAVIITADTRVADAAKIQVAAGTAAATTTEISNAKVYDDAINAPRRPVPVLMCYHPKPTVGGGLPQASAVLAPGIGESGTDGGDGSTFDPSESLLDRAAKADAQITYLQGRIHELETQMRNSP